MSAWVLSLLVASCVLAANGSPTGRIVSETDAPAGKYPFQVSIQYEGKHTCGGSIINKRYILLGGLCILHLKNKINDLTVVVGTNNLDKGGVKYSVEKYIMYAELVEIALFRLKEDIEFTEFVQPVVLSDPLDFESQYNGVLVGWGYKWTGRTIPSKLQHYNVTVIEQSKCVEEWDETATDYNICGTNGLEYNTLFDLSGNILLVDGKQVGIYVHSWNSELDLHILPDLYMRVSSYKNWIDENTKL